MKPLLAVLAIIIIAYLGLFIYAHAGHAIFRYSWEGYSLTYVRYPRLPWPLDVLAFDQPGEYPSIQVNIMNAPKPYPRANARFSVYAVGPAVNGFVDVGRYLSNSTSFSMNLGGYTEYADELDRYLGMTPDDAGPSVTLFISSIGYYGGSPGVSTGFVTIPIIPGLAEGSMIYLDVNFSGIPKAPTLAINGSPMRFTASSSAPQPPGEISLGCVAIGNGPYQNYGECWYWELTKVLLEENNTPFPIVAGMVRQERNYAGGGTYNESNYIASITADSLIQLSIISYTKVGFYSTLSIPTTTGVNIVSPGYGYELSLPTGRSSYMLLSYQCVFANPNYDFSSSYCSYSGIPPSTAPSLTRLGAYGIDLVGYLEVANYTEYECKGPVGDPCYGSITPIRWAIMTWFAAYNNTSVGELEAGTMSPTTMMNYIDELMNYGDLNITLLKDDAIYLTLGSIDSQVGATPLFALSGSLGAMLKAMGVEVPPGLEPFLNYLIVGVSAQSQSVSAIGSAVFISMTPPKFSVCTSPVDYWFDYDVYIQQLNGYYPAPALYVDFNAGPCIG